MPNGFCVLNCLLLSLVGRVASADVDAAPFSSINVIMLAIEIDSVLPRASLHLGRFIKSTSTALMCSSAPSLIVVQLYLHDWLITFSPKFPATE